MKKKITVFFFLFLREIQRVSPCKYSIAKLFPSIVFFLFFCVLIFNQTICWNEQSVYIPNNNRYFISGRAREQAREKEKSQNKVKTAVSSVSALATILQ